MCAVHKCTAARASSEIARSWQPWPFSVSALHRQPSLGADRPRAAGPARRKPVPVDERDDRHEEGTTLLRDARDGISDRWRAELGVIFPLHVALLQTTNPAMCRVFCWWCGVVMTILFLLVAVRRRIAFAAMWMMRSGSAHAPTRRAARRQRRRDVAALRIAPLGTGSLEIDKRPRYVVEGAARRFVNAATAKNATRAWRFARHENSAAKRRVKKACDLVGAPVAHC